MPPRDECVRDDDVVFAGAADRVDADLERVDLLGVHQAAVEGGGCLLVVAGRQRAGAAARTRRLEVARLAAARVEELFAREAELLPAVDAQMHAVQARIVHDGPSCADQERAGPQKHTTSVAKRRQRNRPRARGASQGRGRSSLAGAAGSRTSYSAASGKEISRTSYRREPRGTLISAMSPIFLPSRLWPRGLVVRMRLLS